MSRHGGSLHYVRPDRIVRTGVLSPIVGYQPQRDVLAVTQEFTSGPASGMALAGLGAPSWADRIASPFRQLGLRIKAAIAAQRAKRIMLTAPAQSAVAAVSPMSAVIANAPAGPAIMHAHGVAPQLTAMQDMARFLSMRGTIPMRGEMFTQRRWNTYYFAG